MVSCAKTSRMILATAVVTAAMTVGAVERGSAEEATAKGVTIRNPGLENGGKGWTVELGRGRPNRIVWLTRGAREGKTCAKLIFIGKKWLWLNTPPLDGLRPNKKVTLAFFVRRISGETFFSVGCTMQNRSDGRWAASRDNLWVGSLPNDRRWHELEITFTTPEFDFDKQCLSIKMGPREEPMTVLVDHVRILSVTETEPAAKPSRDPARAHPVRIDFPDERPPADFPDVSRRTIKRKAWREVKPANVCVRAPARVALKMGFHETIPIVINNGRTTKATVELVPGNHMNVYIGRKSVDVAGRGRVEVALPVQTLCAVDFDLVLTVRSCGKKANLPIRIEPQVAYPLFGLVEHFSRCPPRLKRGHYHDAKNSAPAEEDMKYMRLLPCQVFRVDGPGCWSVVERKKGQYSFDAADWCVPATSRFGGARPLMLLGYRPGWAKPLLDIGEREKLDHWRAYVRAMVRRYRNQMDYWEIWNEPYGFWFGGWANNRPKLFQKNYVEECAPILAEVIKIASEEIRKGDPNGKILTPGFVPDAKKSGSDVFRMMEELFKRGMGDQVDFINLHIYPGHNRILPTTPNQGYKVDGKEVVSWRTAARRWHKFDRDTTTKGLRALMEKYGVDKPFWVTEFGAQPAAGERSQGLGILRQVAILASERVQVMHYYEFSDYSHEPSHYQLVGCDDKYRTLGLVAYRQAIRYLTGATHEPGRCEVCCLKKSVRENLPYRVFGRGDETIVCLWSNAATAVKVEIRPKAPYSQTRFSTFSPRGPFLRETILSWDEKTSDDETRLVSDHQLTTILHPLQFKIVSLRTMETR